MLEASDEALQRVFIAGNRTIDMCRPEISAIGKSFACFHIRLIQISIGDVQAGSITT
jgi:hypothetical protein